MTKLIFAGIILVWAFIGFFGIVHAKEGRINYEMIIFMAIVPFIPIIAHLCNLL